MGDVKQSVPRIRTIKFKDGRPPIVLLRRPPRNNSIFMERARGVEREFGENMAGFVIVAWDKENAWDCQYSIQGETNPWPANLLPHFAADSIRRMMAIEDANRVVRGKPAYAWPADVDPDGAS